MELNGEQLIRAPRQKVWAALNDPVTLSRCIPGCEEVAKMSETETHARVMLKVGPVRARFAGKIFMSDIEAPARCTLSFEGAGGAAGFAKGRSAVVLAEEGGATLLSYTVEASVGGKLGQIGGRLIDSSAKKMADEFFAAFDAALQGGAAGAAADVAAAPAGETAPAMHDTKAAPAAAPMQAPSPVFGMPQTHNGGPGFRYELYRAFWLGIGVALTLLTTHWLH